MAHPRTIILALTCLPFLAGCRNTEITSPDSATGTVGQAFTYQITATQEPISFSATVPPPSGLTVNQSTGLISGTPQESGMFSVRLTASNGSTEGVKQLALTIADLAIQPHAVITEKELFMTAPGVLTARPAQPGGAWHIRGALQRIAGDDQDVEQFAQAWFATWANNDSLAGVDDSFKKRPWVTSALQQAWQANRIRLIAIVNRIDLTRFTDGDATQPPTSIGEGRFIYELFDANNQSLPFTIIFEYRLPMATNAQASLLTWAKRWHALGRPDLGGPAEFSEAYITALQGLTDDFSAHGALNQIRTNEFLTAPEGQTQQWELREFHFQETPASLMQAPVVLMPALKHNNQAVFTNFLTANESDIVAGKPIGIPPALQAAVAPVPTPDFTWRAPGASARATFITSFNTCSGCHAGDTGTVFQHSGQRAPQLSPFLRGMIRLAQPLPPEMNMDRMHNEMEARRTLLARFAEDTTALPRALSPTDFTDLIKSRANRPH